MFSAASKIVVNPAMNKLRPLVANVDDIFNASSESLYIARNVIRKISWEGDDFVVKSFRKPKTPNQWIYRFIRKSKAQRSYENSLELVALGFCAPEPVGYREDTRGFALGNSFYISKFLAHRYSLETVLHGSIEEERDLVLKRFGSFISSLHIQGVLHQDLSPGNILIKYDAKRGVEFCLVDVNRMKFGLLTDEERFANFKMLWASDEDLRIIMNAYAEAAGIDPVHAYARALFYSKKHKRRAERKEKIKRWLGLS